MDRKAMVESAVTLVTEEDVKKYKDGEMPVRVKKAAECSSKQLKNAIAEYAVGCRPEEIAVLVDQTILGNGKKGYVYTENGFYASKGVLAEGPFGKPCISYPLMYDELESVRVDETDESYLIITYQSGKMIRAYAGIWTAHLSLTLDAVLRAIASKGQPGAEDHAGNAREEAPCVAEEEESQSAKGAAAEAGTKEEQSKTGVEETAQTGTKVNEPKSAKEAAAQAGADMDAALMEAQIQAAAIADVLQKIDADTPKPDQAGPADEATSAFAEKKKAAEAGDAQAQFDLGLMYEKGEGTAADLAEAFCWYEKAANQGHAQAQCYTGFAYRKGRGVEQDDDKAVYWYKKSAMRNYPPAQYNYAMILKRGDLGEADYEEARYWLEEAAGQDYAKAQERLAQMYQNREGTDLDEEQCRERARSWYEKAAKNGRVDAQFSLATMYYHGEGGVTDQKKALYWFEQAAEQGDATAQTNCGIMYFNGQGTDRDQEKAFAYLKAAIEQGNENAKNVYDKICAQMEKETNREGIDTAGQADRNAANDGSSGRRRAAEAGDPQAQFVYAQYLYFGFEEKPDRAEALKWYERAASQGHAASAYTCATMYLDGDGTKPDQKRGLEWCRKSAMQDQPAAQLLLGEIYYYGKYGVPGNKKRGYYWIEQAKENGLKQAEKLWQELFVEVTMRESGIEFTEDFEMRQKKENPDEARQRRQKEDDQIRLAEARREAAEQGNAVSQYQCGRMLEKGELGSKDPEGALRWYERAAEGGHAEAQFRCAEAYHDGTGTEKNLKKALHWYAKAAENGHGRAQYQLAKMYDEGDGVPENRSNAMILYKQAAEQGVNEAKVRYNVMLLDDNAEMKRILQSKKIMVCDEAAFMRMMTKQMLEQFGLPTPIEAENGRKGIEKYRKEKPDLVFMKLTMRDMDGAQASEEIARRWPDAKIILVYALGQEHIAKDVMRKCPVIIDTLLVPYTKDQLQEMIMKVFGVDLLMSGSL